MAAPTDYAVTISINDVDVTASCPYRDMIFDDHIHQPSRFHFRVENPSGVTPTKGHSVEVIAVSLPGPPVIFSGVIVELETKKVGNAVYPEYVIEAADQKIRLQKSIVSYKSYSGADTTILSDLLTDAYPDLSSLFDFSSGVTGFANDLALTSNEDSLLDMLGHLADLTGGANYSFTPVSQPGPVTFDSGGNSNYTTDSSGFTASETTGGNGGNCFKGTTSSPNVGDYIEVTLSFDTPQVVANFQWDYYLDIPGTPSADIGTGIYVDGVEQSSGSALPGLVYTGDSAWHTWDPSQDVDGLPDFFPCYVQSSLAIRLQIDAATAGSWDVRLDNITPMFSSSYKMITFDGGGASYATRTNDMTSSAEESGGNPGNCFRATGDMSDPSPEIAAKHDLGSATNIYGIGGQVNIQNVLTGNAATRIVFLDDGDSETDSYNMSPVPSDDNTWQCRGTTFTTPISANKGEFEASEGSMSSGTQVFRIDNIIILLSAPAAGSGSGGGTQLNWSQTAPSSDFNFDIQCGDEFAFDIDLMSGDWDDYNSITVVGGYEQVTIDWTYESDGDLTHINLETAVEGIAIYKNTNTDASPTWTAQTDGVYGVDKLTSQGGSSDVLYDPDRHWLWFNSAPSNLSKSVRVTGTIARPIRVRVENVTSGDPTYATTLHDDTITSEAQAVAAGDAELERRNAATRLTFTTYEPGLKPGQSLNVADSARGLNETLVIRRISTRWLGGSGHAEFRVECGTAEPPSVERLIAANARRSRAHAPAAGLTTQSVNKYTDDGGSDVMTDDSENVLYEVS